MLRKSSLTQEAYERLRSDLLTCRLKPGERLRIKELCARLSVSLGAVREALSRLTAEGLVSAEPQRGFRAAPLSAVDFKDLARVRTQIEGLCLRRAIEVGDLAWESRIVAAYHLLSSTPCQAADDPQRLSDEYSRVHADFHEELVSACDSPWLCKLRSMLFTQSARYRGLSVPLARVVRDRDREHRELMEAVLAREPERAVASMKQHVELTSRILLDAMVRDQQISGSSSDQSSHRQPVPQSE
jgi:DNA-binding GntR family transcriptional regulator